MIAQTHRIALDGFFGMMPVAPRGKTAPRHGWGRRTDRAYRCRCGTPWPHRRPRNLTRSHHLSERLRQAVHSRWCNDHPKTCQRHKQIGMHKSIPAGANLASKGNQCTRSQRQEDESRATVNRSPDGANYTRPVYITETSAVNHQGVSLEARRPFIPRSEVWFVECRANGDIPSTLISLPAGHFPPDHSTSRCATTLARQHTTSE